MKQSYIKVTPTTFQLKQKWQLTSCQSTTAACKPEGLTPRVVSCLRHTRLSWEIKICSLSPERFAQSLVLMGQRRYGKKSTNTEMVGLDDLEVPFLPRDSSTTTPCNLTRDLENLACQPPGHWRHICAMCGQLTVTKHWFNVCWAFWEEADETWVTCPALKLLYIHINDTVPPSTNWDSKGKGSRRAAAQSQR